MNTQQIKQLIADSLRKARIKSGMTQEKLAAKAGISTRYYQNLENAKQRPSIEILLSLASALNQHYSLLIDPIWNTQFPDQ